MVLGDISGTMLLGSIRYLRLDCFTSFMGPTRDWWIIMMLGLWRKGTLCFVRWKCEKWWKNRFYKCEGDLANDDCGVYVKSVGDPAKLWKLCLVTQILHKFICTSALSVTGFILRECVVCHLLKVEKHAM